MQTIPYITPQLLIDADAHLRKTVPQLRAAIEQHAPCTLKPNGYDPFHALVHSIISQQLSTKAGNTIFQRFITLLDTPHVIADTILRFTADDFRAVGISAQKSNYIIGLAEEVASGNLDFKLISALPDAEVIHSLTRIKGIGTWTAEMFLIFSLGRPDVVSLSDVGIQRAVQNMYGLEHKPSADQLLAISTPWRPYRSIACWYLWKSLN